MRTEITWENVVSLQISIRQYNDVTILDLIGKWTIAADESELLSQRLRALTDNGRRKLLLNLANVSQIDSTGISVIVESYFCLQRQDGELKLLGPRGRVLEVLTLFRLLDSIHSFKDETQALASFRPGSEVASTEASGNRNPYAHTVVSSL
jgi:anti-sigma B factor antagonist